jgi:hypothetical protein
MSVRWYYQYQTGVVGPVSFVELKYLLSTGALGASSLVRRGDDGPWIGAQEIEDLFGRTSSSAHTPGVSLSDAAGWHFNLKGQNRQGPVAWSVLKSMVAASHVLPDDLVWKPGMAMWVSASRVPGLVEDLTAPAVGRGDDPGGSDFSVPRRVLWAGATVTVLLALSAVIVGWRGAHRGSRDEIATRAWQADALIKKKDRPKPGVAAVEQLLDDARVSVRVEQLDRARRLLDQYLADSRAVQATAAKKLLHDINNATSDSDAALIAKDLNDEPLKAFLRQGVQPLVAEMETAELGPTYERTLLRAFRQENNRRQMVPRGAFAQAAEPVGAGPIGKDEPALLRPPPANPVPDQNGILAERAVGLMAADFGAVAKKPEDFQGKTLLLDGLFKIGTKISEVRTRDGQVLGKSLPVARNDDSALFTADRKVDKGDFILLLDDRFALFLDHVFSKLNLRMTLKPSYKCILTVTIRRLLIDDDPTPVVVITAMEVLGGCDYLSVARHQYSQAFRTLTVNSGEADVDFGDGDLWVERLGGEENFVQPIRRKFREMQRRAVTNRDSAVIDRILQRELANVVSTATAINHIVAMEGLRRMRILP